MAVPHLHAVSPVVSATVPITGRAARIRLALQTRHQELSDYDEVGAIDVAAAMLATWSEAFDSLVPRIAADRTPRYRHKQLDGEVADPLEDVVFVCLSEPVLAAAGLSVLVERMGYAPLAPATSSGLVGSPHAEAAQAIEAFGRAMATFTRAAADGRLTPAEAAVIENRIDELLVQVLDWRTAVRRVMGGETNGS